MKNIIIEQTHAYRKRIEYNPERGTFTETQWDSLFYARGVTFPYGWLKDSGTPPGDHLDVFLISREHYNLGDDIAARIIGVFKREDGDHKLVAVLPDRVEMDISDLQDADKDELYRMYPRIGEGEGWFGAEAAREIIRAGRSPKIS